MDEETNRRLDLVEQAAREAKERAIAVDIVMIALLEAAVEADPQTRHLLRAIRAKAEESVQACAEVEADPEMPDRLRHLMGRMFAPLDETPEWRRDLC